MAKNTEHDESLKTILQAIENALHRANHILKKLMIHQADFDAAIAALTAAITSAAAAIAAGSGAAVTPDSMVQPFISNVVSLTNTLNAALQAGGTPGPLAIVTQPSSPATIAVGTVVSLKVIATGASPTYQWNKNGAAILLGATSSTFTIDTAAVTDSGSYTVTVTDASGSVTSTPVVLTVA